MAAKRPPGRSTRGRVAERPAVGKRATGLLRSYVAPEVVAHITSNGRVPLVSGVRTPVSVLFADLRGFTSVAAVLAPERVVRLLDDFFSVMADVAVAHRAVIDKLIGDAIMLLYGVPGARRDDPLRAVRTALDMQQSFLSLRNRWLSAGRPEAAPLGLGVGVATGPVVMAHVGSAVRMDYTAVGEPVNRAAHLCGAAQHGEILVDQESYARSATALEREALFTSTERDLKGLDAVAVYRCQARRAALRAVAPGPPSDPVCHMKVSPRAAIRRTVQGRAYLFCSRTCAQRFTENPDAFRSRADES
jgi:class 3 adenylate cyclase/YHS domain-containing protein